MTDGEPSIVSKQTPRAAEISALVDRWHFENFHGSRLGHDTELWNLVLHAMDDLKRRLAEIIKEK